jgi:hypothetical protein
MDETMTPGQVNHLDLLTPDERADVNPDVVCLSRNPVDAGCRCTRSVDHRSDFTPCACACGAEFWPDPDPEDLAEPWEPDLAQLADDLTAAFVAWKAIGWLWRALAQPQLGHEPKAFQFRKRDGHLTVLHVDWTGTAVSSIDERNGAQHAVFDDPEHLQELLDLLRTRFPTPNSNTTKESK